MGTQLLILCGGKATRLRGINGGVPKCLLRIDGKPILTHLINNLGREFDRITVSYAGSLEIYSSAIVDELEAGLANRLIFAHDEKQHGTAHAVQMHSDQAAASVTVVNGDTIFSDYSGLLPDAVGTDEIVLSTSFQTVGRAGAVQQNIETGKIDFKKERDGGITQTNWVTNGVITFGASALRQFCTETVPQGLSLENAALSLQTRHELTFTLYQAKTRFLDIGVPDDFTNAETKYRELAAAKS